VISLTALDLLRLLLQFGLLLLLARVLGEVARRLNQPQVIGELLAGVVLGPSLFGSLFPHTYADVFTHHGLQPALLSLVSEFGVIFLLLLSGLETNVDVVRKKARPALVIAACGVAVPFAAGYGLAQWLPASLHGSPSASTAFSLFVATALSISAIPVIVKILLDMNLMHRDIGQLTLAAGIINDTTGWFLLAFVSGIALSQHGDILSLLISIGGTLAFALFCFTLGYRALRAIIRYVDDHVGGESPVFTVVILSGLAGAAVTQALHVEPFLGSFVVGVQLARVPRVNRAVRARLEGLTLAVFAPVFFASAGLQVNIPELFSGPLLLSLLAVLVVAVIAKFVGTYIGARAVRLNHWLAISLGAGMNARGAVEIIVATIGLQMGILTVPMYSIIVLMAVLTSMMAPPLLRAALARTPSDPEETDRLRKERFAQTSFLFALHRMLVPVRDGRAALLAAQIVQRLAAERMIEATSLHIQQEREPTQPNTAAAPANVAWKHRSVTAGADVGHAILEEARRGYDLLVLGAGGGRSRVGVFGRIVDRVVLRAPCNIFVLSAARAITSVDEFQNILIPTTGTAADLRAAEFALALAKGTHAHVTAVHVLEIQPLAGPLGSEAVDMRRLQFDEDVGWHAIAQIQHMAEAFDVQVDGAVIPQTSASTGAELVRYADTQSADLILLSAERRPAGDELYCGKTVEWVARSARCPVGVLFGASEGAHLT